MDIQTDFIKCDNLGTPNKNVLTIGNLSLWFSYKTIVAFSGNNGFYVVENVYSKTTGKLLNELEQDKKKRLNVNDFKAKLQEAFIIHGLANAEILKNL